MSDLISFRSDASPGRFICVECRGEIGNLREAWRGQVDQMSSSTLSTLFCSGCAQRLNMIGLGLSPIALTQVEMLNLQMPIG